jgi:hypothetical protein
MGFDCHATALAASGIGILPVGSGNNAFTTNNNAGRGSDRLEAYPTDGVNLLPFVTSVNPQPQARNDGASATEAEDPRLRLRVKRPHEELFWRDGLDGGHSH